MPKLNFPEEFEAVKCLRDQTQKNHPVYQAQNLLTGAGQPIMSPKQKSTAIEDMKLIRNSLTGLRKKKLSSEIYINNAFKSDEYKSQNL